MFQIAGDQVDRPEPYAVIRHIFQVHEDVSELRPDVVVYNNSNREQAHYVDLIIDTIQAIPRENAQAKSNHRRRSMFLLQINQLLDNSKFTTALGRVCADRYLLV